MRRLASLPFDGVERDAGGPPTAFRIWRSGENVTDHGVTVFSPRSAELLLAQQTDRGNLFPIDVDHLSLNIDAPIENRRAVGWFAIEVRDGELWATNVEWTDSVRDGLTKEPPEWRYHSPAYDQDPKTDEVVSLLNLAITNLPATHNVTALASRGASRRTDMSNEKMSWGDIKAALDGDDENKKAAAYAAIQAAFPEEKPKDEEGEKDADGEKKEPEEKKDADESEKKEEKKASHADAAGLLAEHDAELRRVKAELDGFRKEREDGEKKRLIAARQMSAELATKLATKPLALVKEIVDTLPLKAQRDPAAAERVTATRGDSQGDRSARQPQQAAEEMRERMGLLRRQACIRRDGNDVMFGVMTSEDAKGFLASKNQGVSK